MWAAIIMLRRRLVSFSISAAWVRRGDTFPRLKPLLSQTTLQLVLKSTVTGIIMQQSVLYPCSIKTLEVLGNPSPMPKRCPEGRWKWSRGGGSPNTSQVLVECRYSIINSLFLTTVFKELFYHPAQFCVIDAKLRHNLRVLNI